MQFMAPTGLIFNTFVTTPSQLPILKSTSIEEIILEHKDLSRFGTLNTEQLIALIHESSEQGYSPSLQWDILATDQNLFQGIDIFKQLPISKIVALRVQDAGVAEFIRQQFPLLPLHLIVETGNHNLTSLQRWSDYFGNQLQRLILSTELSGKTLQSYCEQLKVSCEILGLGRILLFYTPRSLLHSIQQNQSPSLEKIVTSDEHPHHHFPIIQNAHGTFMFHYYDLFLLDLLPELMKTNLKTMRIDLRFTNLFERIQTIDSLRKNYQIEQVKQLKTEWPIHTIHGFYRANRTDRPIERLKNKYLKNHGENLVAYVVEALKDQYLALVSRKSFHTKEKLLFITPEGKEIQICPLRIQNTQGQEVESTNAEGIWLIPHHKWIVPKTLVYRLIND